MRFSVIIPLYNKAPYIEKALQSVLEQTFDDFEVIVVDDGSTDNSYSTARSVLEVSERPFKLIHQENAGVSTARNNGVAASHGEFICFLDGDDWWAPTFLEKIDELIREYPEAGIYGTNYYYVKNGRQRVCVTTAETGYINYCKAYSEKLQMPLWTGAVAIPRIIFDKMEGFRSNLSLGEDFDLWIKIALQYRVAFLNNPQSYYNQDADVRWRLVSKLHDPSSHMLWNLDYLADEEARNPDFKHLVDNIRVYSLLPYYLSKKYRETAKKELNKVDWTLQDTKTRRQYSQPIALLKAKMAFRKCGSAVKQWILRHI